MDVPLTPIVVDVVTFDRAPLGRRGYNEDQVDDFLDRVQAALAGKDALSAREVREVEFDAAPLIRRGYHEDQVDEFLDLVVDELGRRENLRFGTAPGAPAQMLATPMRPGPAAPPAPPGPTPPPAPAITHAPTHLRPLPPPTPAEQTNPLFPAPLPGRPAVGPPTSSVTTGTDTTSESPVRESPSGSTSPAEPAVTPSPEPPMTESAAAPPEPPAEPPAPQEAGEPEVVVEETSETDESSGLLAQPLDTHPTEPENANGQLAQLAAQLEPQPEPAPAPEPKPEPEPAEDLPESHLSVHTPTTPVTPVAGPDAWRDADQLVLPLPPAPPGERGYRPGDVERLMRLLADILASPDAPDPVVLAELKLSRTFFVGQGYHVGAVDAVRTAWLEELDRRSL